MNKFLLLLLVSLIIIPLGCKKQKSSDDPKPVSTINGKWKYDSNLTAGACEDLFTTTIEIKDGEANALSVPDNRFGFKAGEKWFVNIKQTTSANNFSANGVVRNAGGAVANPNDLVDIVIQAGGQEMTVESKSNVCNPKQKWIKIP
ncbi:hypothetical protein MUK70_03380 [Dyadobacter chenwenxiniae]|uniref:Uncharacterized protein n=1 Tax=Dyadobacter chenwenxiniae TaxID=2906456 RepID=A0A9X1PSS6_9BACT|nr:hypothetical protein [Dyadobacter chenwenxiniae]MCF0065809.1 hypothetical protein [Dyadobacter chenwenxiniae]UON84036.1 hypothetical protein MUK70_03380 [Dyadobacter chenwenxiniae]